MLSVISPVGALWWLAASVRVKAAQNRRKPTCHQVSALNCAIALCTVLYLSVGFYQIVDSLHHGLLHSPAAPSSIRVMWQSANVLFSVVVWLGVSLLTDYTRAAKQIDQKEIRRGNARPR